MISAADTAITIDAAFITAFFGGLAVIVTTIVTAYLKLQHYQHGTREKQAEKLEEIHTAVNSNMTAAQAEIKRLNEKVALLVKARKPSPKNKKPSPKSKPVRRRR